jgi:hypothetical protein
MEMQLIHVNKDYIKGDGAFNETAARSDANGFAIISIFFQVKQNWPWGVS